MDDLLYDSPSHDPRRKLTSVGDCGRFLAEVQRGKLISPQASARMVDRLSRQQRRSKIPAGVPDGVAVANKTGETVGVENDAAIVSVPSGAYVLVVMTEGSGSATSQADIRDLSALVWQTLGQ